MVEKQQPSKKPKPVRFNLEAARSLFLRHVLVEKNLNANNEWWTKAYRAEVRTIEADRIWIRLKTGGSKFNGASLEVYLDFGYLRDVINDLVSPQNGFIGTQMADWYSKMQGALRGESAQFTGSGGSHAADIPLETLQMAAEIIRLTPHLNSKYPNFRDFVDQFDPTINSEGG